MEVLHYPTYLDVYDLTLGVDSPVTWLRPPLGYIILITTNSMPAYWPLRTSVSHADT